MSPAFKGGFHPNPQVAAMHNKAAAGPAAAPPAMAAPADPMMGDQPKSVTLTEQPDGSYSIDDGSGQPVMAASLDEAMQHMQTMMGGDEMADNPTGDTGEVSSSMSGDDDGGGGY